jgi:hypothetical protein
VCLDEVGHYYIYARHYHDDISNTDDHYKYKDENLHLDDTYNTHVVSNHAWNIHEQYHTYVPPYRSGKSDSHETSIHESNHASYKNDTHDKNEACKYAVYSNGKCGIYGYDCMYGMYEIHNYARCNHALHKYGMNDSYGDCKYEVCNHESYMYECMNRHGLMCNSVQESNHVQNIHEKHLDGMYNIGD